jgi:beta-ketodecanoyl-[acyl-carrier-protein] synthase
MLNLRAAPGFLIQSPMKQVVIGTGLLPALSISNEELVAAFNTTPPKFNANHAGAIAAGELALEPSAPASSKGLRHQVAYVMERKASSTRRA